MEGNHDQFMMLLTSYAKADAAVFAQAMTYPIPYGNKTWFPAPPPEVALTTLCFHSVALCS